MNSIHARQYAMFVLIAGSVLSLVVVGLFLSDAGRRGTRPEHMDRVQDFRRFGDDIDPEQIWLRQSGADLQSLREDNESLRAELRRLDDRLSDLLSAEREDVPRRPPADDGQADHEDRPGRDFTPARAPDAISLPADTLPAVAAGPVPLPEVTPSARPDVPFPATAFLRFFHQRIP